MENTIRTPIAFLIFNRPDTTAKVFERIRQSRTPKLFVVADGPRPDKPGETDKCKTARSIIERVDWPCEVLTNYSDINLGCKRRVSSGLDWVFNMVEEAIILEDDCVPDPTFFRYCEELLARYRGDSRVMMIAGVNFQFGKQRTPYSYFFSKYAYIWGWASWRRSWKNYDATMKLWPEIRDRRLLDNIFRSERVKRYWHNIFEKVYHEEIDTWDYQWMFTCMINNGLIVMPDRNLITNIGFGGNATHTTWDSILSDIKTESMQFPLSHPTYFIRSEESDAILDKKVFVATLATRIRHKITMYKKRAIRFINTNMVIKIKSVLSNRLSTERTCGFNQKKKRDIID